MSGKADRWVNGHCEIMVPLKASPDATAKEKLDEVAAHFAYIVEDDHDPNHIVTLRWEDETDALPEPTLRGAIPAEAIEAAARAAWEGGRAVWDSHDGRLIYTTDPGYDDLTLDTKEWYRAMAEAAAPAIRAQDQAKIADLTEMLEATQDEADAHLADAKTARQQERERMVARIEATIWDLEGVVREGAGTWQVRDRATQEIAFLRALVTATTQPTGGDNAE